MPSRNFLLLALLLLPALLAGASTIQIADPSFEDASLSPGGWTHLIAPWLETDGPDNTNAFKEWIEGFSADGDHHLGMNNGHRVWQDLDAMYEDNTRYTLTVAVGHRPGQNAFSGTSLFRLESPDGEVFAEGEFNAIFLDDHEFADQAVSFDTPDVPASVGETIRIVLTGTGGGRSHFDHVRLTAESLLPPESPELGPVSGEALTARTASVEGEVLFDGHETPEVTVVYGENDGGTDLGAWQSQTRLGDRDGVFEVFLDGLSPETEYFFRAYAENSGGVAWAPASASFTTPELRAPELGPLSGTIFSARTASVDGEVVFFEHEAPEVTVVYGESDGGTDLGAWENQTVLGQRDGAFEAFLADLSPDTEYYFRAIAENPDGVAWSTPAGPLATPPPQPGRAVINEFFYKPLDKNVLEEFIELYNPGDTDVDLSGWEITTAVRYTFPAGTVLPAGGYVVVGEDPGTMLSEYGVEAFGPWDGSLSSDGESIQLVDAGGEIHDRVDYNAGFPWPTMADGEGSSVELLHPELDNTIPGYWRASGFGVGEVGAIGPPTPGAPNSVHIPFESVPPVIDRVVHVPQKPRSGDTVTISARVFGPAEIETVHLSYQLVDPGEYIRITDTEYETDWTDLPMELDRTSGANVFSVELPPEIQEHRRLVRYRIIGEDVRGNVQTVPYPDDEQPNFAYYVYDGLPDWQGAFEPGETDLETYPAEFLDTLPVYTLIAADEDVVNSQYNSSFDGDRLPGTFVYDGIVYDHVRFRNRGQASTYVAGKNKWRIHFNTSRRGEFHNNEGEPYREDWGFLTVNAAASPWVAANRGIAGVDEVLPFLLYQEAGMLSPHTHYFHFRVVRNAEESPAAGTTHDDRLGTADGQFLSDFWGLYYTIEPIRGPFIRERDLPKGSIYQIEGSNTQPQESGGTDKEYQGFGQPSDFSDWAEFRDAVNSGPSQEWWEDNFELEAYYTFHALNRLLGNVDVRAYANYHLYHRPTDGRWVIIPWDLDMMFIAKSHHTHNGIPGVTLPHRVLTDHPHFALQFRNRAREILDLVAEDGSDEGGQIGQFTAYFADIVGREEPINWANADAAMWNWHPRTRGDPNNPSGQANHRGHFFWSPYVDSRIDGDWTRWLRRPDFVGHAEHADFMNFIRDYVTDTWPGGTWEVSNGDQRGYGYQYLAWEAADSDIPDRPELTYTGSADFPPNGLEFEASDFSGRNNYAATAWRIAEIGRHDPDEPPAYEIRANWESGELDHNGTVTIPPDVAETGRTYRARVRHLDNTGRWSHWSEPVEFTAGDPIPSTLLHYWNFNDTETLLEPTLTRTGGSLSPTPGAQTEFTHASGQDFAGDNARLGDPAGDHFRINSPLGSVIRFHVPTTGYDDIVLRYETRRSRQGAGTQIVSVSTDGTSFEEFIRYPVFNDPPVRKTLDFSSYPGAADNPDFTVRITFLPGDGSNAGNNRFDNVTVDGISLDGGKPPPTVTSNPSPVSITAGDTPVAIDLETVFSDPEGASLTFSAASDRPEIASPEIEDSILTLTGHAPGEARITVTADDENNDPVAAVIRALVYPVPHDLSAKPFRFDTWAPNSPEMMFPDGMIFLQSSINDPELDTELAYAYFIPEHEYASGDSYTVGFPYNNNSRTRINGLGERGISLINTGRSRDVGAAIVALDTRDIDQARIGFTAETILPNSRVYALRLQYRIGPEGPFHDLHTPSGQIIEYLRSPTAGHEAFFGPVELPSETLGHENLQLAWRHYLVDGENGPRAELRLDNILVTAGDPPENTFEGWRLAHYPEWPAYLDNRVSGPFADPGNAGANNLLRYAFGLTADPRGGTSYAPHITTTAGDPPRVRFRFDPDLTDLAWLVEASSDLGDWSEILFDSRNDPPPAIDEGWAEVELPSVSEEFPRRFVRVRVIRDD